MRKFCGICVVLCVCVLMAMGPGLKGGFLNWDDDVHLYQNPQVSSLDFKNIQKIFTSTISETYIPLTVLSFAIEHQVVGLHPFLYHFNNVLLHLANVFLVLMLGMQLGLSLYVSAGAALIFGVHPMHVESVAWVTERKDVLYAFFYLLALICYVRYIKTGLKRFYWISVVCCVLGMLSKAMALSLVLILCLIDWFMKRNFSRKLFWEKVPFFLCIVPIAWITYSMNARIPELQLTRSPLVWIWTFSFYVLKFLVPIDLTPYYVLAKPVGIQYPQYLMAVGVFVLFWIAMIWGMIRCRWLTFAGLFYFLSIFFLLRFDELRDTSFVADRFMYLPSLGFCFLAAIFVNWACTYFTRKNLALGVVSKASAFILVLLLIWGAHGQSKIWNNNISFWNYVLKVNPNIARAHNHRGAAWVERGEYDLAIEDFSAAIRLLPKYPRAYCNRGDLLARKEEFGAAIEDFNKALAFDPRFKRAYSSRGIVYSKQKKYDLAIADFSQAVSLDPTNPNNYNNRGIAYKLTGDYDQALTDFGKAIELDPRLSPAYINRGRVYRVLGKADLALSDLNDAIRLKPDAELLLGERARLFFELKKFSESLSDYDRILKMNSNNASAYYNRAQVYFALGNNVAAQRDLVQAENLKARLELPAQHN